MERERSNFLTTHQPPTYSFSVQFFYTFLQPGVYAYLSHNLIEAVQLGALAHFVVDGKWDDDLMTQVSKPGPIPA